MVSVQSDGYIPILCTVVSQSQLILLYVLDLSVSSIKSMSIGSQGELRGGNEVMGSLPEAKNVEGNQNMTY